MRLHASPNLPIATIDQIQVFLFRRPVAPVPPRAKPPVPKGDLVGGLSVNWSRPRRPARRAPRRGAARVGPAPRSAARARRRRDAAGPRARRGASPGATLTARAGGGAAGAPRPGCIAIPSHAHGGQWETIWDLPGPYLSASRPGRHSTDLPPLPVTGRLRCVLAPRKTGRSHTASSNLPRATRSCRRAR